MIPVLLIILPLLTGLITFFIKDERSARSWSLLSSFITLFVLLGGLLFLKDGKYFQFQCDWLPAFGSSFSVKIDGMGQLLCLLTAIAYPLVFLSTWNATYTNARNFFAFMLLAQAGLMGVFVAMDALLFYFFWELALIPMYFLCSIWGGEKRIQATFKFFIYTFVGSLLMLVGIIYVYAHTPDHSFDITAFYKSPLSGADQNFVFWLFFIAFAIKMPIFPFHTWQPDTYEQAPTATTMILSGVMVKMGVFGLIRWLLPVMPIAFHQWGDVTTSLAVAGMIYASLIAIKQDDLKRLVAYSSIAHIGLMCAAVFSENKIGMQGVMIQMFNHGINIIGLWIIVEWIERKFGTRKISDLGGIAQKAPVAAIFVVIVAFANIALPLTNAFAGEFLMFNGLLNSKTMFSHAVWFTVISGLSVILAAVYTLNMIRKVFFGSTNELTGGAGDIGWGGKAALAFIVVLIFWTGFFPQSLLNITNEISGIVLNKIDLLQTLPGK